MAWRQVLHRLSAKRITGVLAANSDGFYMTVPNWERLAAICATGRLAYDDALRLAKVFHPSGIGA